MSALGWLGVALLVAPLIVGYVAMWRTDRETALILTGVVAFMAWLVAVGLLVEAGTR